MEKEISSGTMLGIVLIALAAVIGLGFGVFSIAKGVANEGTVGVQDNLNVVSDSAYEDYNDKVVTGTMVKSAVQNFTGKSCAILIHTTAMEKGVKTYNTHENICVWAVDDKDYINYNAVLGGTSDAEDAVTIIEKGGDPINGEGSDLVSGLEDDSIDTAIIKDGVLSIQNPFATDDNGKIKYDNSIGGFSRTGNCEYIATGGKFEANLINDASGTTVGIIFTQMAK